MPAPRKPAKAAPDGATAAKPRKPRARKAPAPPPPRPPEPPYDAPLEGLTRDQLSVFVYLAVLPEQTAKLVDALKLSLPGFRRERLGDVQRADLIADEILAVPERRAAVLDVLRADFKVPAFAGWGLSPAAADELLDVVDHEDALALTLWRILCDPDAAVRGRAAPLLDELARALYGEPGQQPAPRKGDAAATPEQELAKLEKKLADARARLEAEEARGEARVAEERRRREEERERLQGQLRESRAAEAGAREEAKRAREAAEGAARERGRAEDALAALRAQDVAVELQRARRALDDAEARERGLEARLERARERERELEAERDLARSAGGAGAGGGAPGGADDAEEPEDAAAGWLMPVYTREFYDSLAGWDRRVQRAAFKQAHLLAQDHRHPSLRALPLEGIPGYYRVRVATDVRLIYRRGEQQNTVEILSLIDREDLDRYVKQAKTRG